MLRALLAAIFCVGAACVAVLDGWHVPRAALRRPESPSARVDTVGVVLSILTALVGVVAAVWVIRTGHEGARITWSGVDVAGLTVD